MQAHRLFGLIGYLGLDHEEIDIAMRTGLSASVRAKQDHLGIGSGSSQPTSRLSDQCLVNHPHSWGS